MKCIRCAEPQRRKRHANAISLLVPLLLITANTARSQDLRLVDVPPNGPRQIYDDDYQYLRLVLKKVSPPGAPEENGPIRRFFRQRFLKAKDLALLTLQVRNGDQELAEIVIYSAEKNGRTEIRHVTATPTIPYRVTRPFLLAEPNVLTLRIKQSVWQEREDVVKGLLDTMFEQGTLAISGTPGLTEFLSLFLQPNPQSESETIEATVALDDLADGIVGHSLLMTSDSGSAEELVLLSFETVGGYFHDHRLTLGLERARLSAAVEPWQERIRSADDNLGRDGLQPLLEAVRAFSDFVATLPLNIYDSATLTACAVKEWAPGAWYGVENGTETLRFTDTHFMRLPTGDPVAIAGGSCDLTEGSCSSSQCEVLKRFLAGSDLESRRRDIGSLSLEGGFTMAVNDDVRAFSVQDYNEDFAIVEFGPFCRSGPDSFVFSAGRTTARVDGVRYFVEEATMGFATAAEREGQPTIVGLTLRATEAAAQFAASYTELSSAMRAGTRVECSSGP